MRVCFKYLPGSENSTSSYCSIHQLGLFAPPSLTPFLPSPKPKPHIGQKLNLAKLGEEQSWKSKRMEKPATSFFPNRRLPLQFKRRQMRFNFKPILEFCLSNEKVNFLNLYYLHAICICFYFLNLYYFYTICSKSMLFVLPKSN